MGTVVGDNRQDSGPAWPPAIYEDDYLLVVDKPAGVTVHPSPRWRYDTVIQRLRARPCEPGSRVQLAHRLDRETSGVLVVTKDPETNRIVHETFAAGRARKTYLALVVGDPAWDRTRAEAPIGKHPSSDVLIRMAVVPDGAASTTEFTVVERLAGHALVEARPLTGRTHQIRVHLGHLGHPVLGDKIYGPDEQLFIRWYEGRTDDQDWRNLGMDRHALHAERLVLPHPWRSGDVDIRAPLPSDMRSKVAALREAR